MNIENRKGLMGFNRYAKLKAETINEHALLYTWKGSDPNLKPILFMGHTDVSSPSPSGCGMLI